MNGRLYDPTLGRVLSADPLISHAFSLQSYDRYAYVNSNPLAFTDPTGFADCLGVAQDRNGCEKVEVTGNRLAGYGMVGGSYFGASVSGAQLAILFSPGSFSPATLPPVLVPLAAACVANKAACLAVAAVVIYSASPQVQEMVKNLLSEGHQGSGGGSSGTSEQEDAAGNALGAGGANSTSASPPPDGEDPNKRQLTQEEKKAIRSYEKRINEHEQKLAEFKANPTVRPGMEGQPQEVIERQQAARIQHLETEIRGFRGNIDKILNGR